ncbi:hypothetical protein TcCL_NonESM06489 [Trypanosoma cruzi]|nr:hypothetical protein TcCL_NonESM06489 [Trypanosoma cruzi]
MKRCGVTAGRRSDFRLQCVLLRCSRNHRSGVRPSHGCTCVWALLPPCCWRLTGGCAALAHRCDPPDAVRTGTDGWAEQVLCGVRGMYMQRGPGNGGWVLLLSHVACAALISVVTVVSRIRT